MDMHRNRNNSFVGLSPLVLFLSSYIPLFGLIALRQFYNNLIYLNWSGFNKPAIICFLSKFGISVLCLIIIVFGLIGTYFVCSIQRQGIVITKNKDIQEGDQVQIYNIGYQLYFGNKRFIS